MLSVRGLGKTYPRSAAPGLQDITFELRKGHTLGIAGASGSGKSTLARCIALFETPTTGEILIDGKPVQRSDVQLIFQQPASTLNPRFTAAEILDEPLRIQRRGTPSERAAAVRNAIETVGIPIATLGRRALQFSGGERQRLAIARALILQPRLLLLDEPFSGLDPRSQARIAELLESLRQQHDLTYLLISHDLEVIGRLATDIAVMQNGRIVEFAPAPALLSSPQHSYTRQLVQASLALSL